MAVTDDELLDSIGLLARKTGVFAEPSGVAALAGLKRLTAAGVIKSHEKTVLLVTGTGLKDPLSASRTRPDEFPEIYPDLNLLEKEAPPGVIPLGRSRTCFFYLSR